MQLLQFAKAAGAVFATSFLCGCNDLKTNVHSQEEMLELCLDLAASKLAMGESGSAAIVPSSGAGIEFGSFGSYKLTMQGVRFPSRAVAVNIECSGDGNSSEIELLKLDQTAYSFSPTKKWDPE